MITYILTSIGSIFCFCLFMLYRNHWVYKTHMEALSKGLVYYSRLASYDSMLCRFWIFDVSKFLDTDKS